MTTTAPDFGTSTEESAGDKKRLIIAGGLIAALALGAGGYLLLSGGSDDDLALGVPPARPSTTKSGIKATAAKGTKPAAKPQVPVVSSVKLGRDPFVALYTVPVATPDDKATAAGSTAGTGTTGTGSTTPIAAPYSLQLLSITGAEGKLYAFKVGGDNKTVVAAQKFGKYGELVVLAYIKSSKGAVVGALVQVGDDDPVSVKIGEKITVL